MGRTWHRPDNNVEATQAAAGLAPTKRALDEVVVDIHNAADQIKSTPESNDPIEPEEVTFRPSREQRKLKAMFGAVAKSKKLDIKSGVTLELVLQLVPGCRTLRNWWHNELFVEWFTNASSYQQRIDYLIDLQLDNLEDVITNREGIFTARDQVAAGRQLAEYKKAFIEEDKADRPDMGADMIKALAARVVAAKQLPAANAEATWLPVASERVLDIDAPDESDIIRIELPK